MKTSNNITKTAIFFAISYFLASCTLNDLEPEGGFPEYQSADKDYIDLSPQSEFDFHKNPELIEVQDDAFGASLEEDDEKDDENFSFTDEDVDEALSNG